MQADYERQLLDLRAAQQKLQEANAEHQQMVQQQDKLILDLTAESSHLRQQLTAAESRVHSVEGEMRVLLREMERRKQVALKLAAAIS